MANQTVNVKTALEILDQSRSEDEDFLVEKFASITNCDASSINKNALVSKLYRYKSKLKEKRGKNRTEFENELFSLPVSTSIAPVKGKLIDEKIASYEKACSSLASELHQQKQKSKEDIERLNEMHESSIKQLKSFHTKEIKTLKRAHSVDVLKQTKKLKLAGRKNEKKGLLEADKKEKYEEKLQNVIKSKKGLSDKHALLKRQLERYKRDKLKLKLKINTTMSKVVIQEKQKVQKYVREVESLKLDNMKLKATMNEQESEFTKMSEQIKTFKETEFNHLQVSLKDIIEERDYLHTIVQDNVELKLFDTEKKKYTPQTRQCIMNITSCNVSSENVGPVIKEVLKLANKSPNVIPSRKTVDNIIVEKIAVGQKQIGKNLPELKNTCLYGDETRKFGKTYETFLLSDENKNVYFLGLRDMSDKAASTTLDIFINLLDDISDVCEQNRQNNITSPGHGILCNIRNFMSDRAQTNIAFNDLLEQYRLEIMPNFIQNWNNLTDSEKSLTSKVNNFFCGLHLLVNFAECLSPILQLFEKLQETEAPMQDSSDDDEPSQIQIFSSDSKTISFLRFCGKCFGRGVDEKSGCYSAFRTHCENENEKVMFVDFRGNRFNIIFLMGQIAFYHHQRIQNFFENVHGTNNKLHKLTLQLVKKPYIIACCKVLGLMSKLITAPLWRLIESNKHVLDLNQNYHALLQYLERMSNDANTFLSGQDYPFPNGTIEKDFIFDKLITADDGLDGKACAFAQMAFKGLHAVLERAMKEQLPGGKFFEPTHDLQDQTKSVIPHNKIPERVFGILDFFLRYRPNASTISNEAFLMFVFNKTSEWLETLPQEEREKLLNESIKKGREIRTNYRKRLVEITEHRKQKLKDRQIALEKKHKAALKTKSKHTGDIIYYGLWQKADQVETKLDEIDGVTEKRKALVAQIRFRQKVMKQTVSDKTIYQVSAKGKAVSINTLKMNVLKLIEDAGTGPGVERKSQNVPLFVGKRVTHTFEEGKWNGRVVSVVKGFPDFYNIIYDRDLEDTCTPTAIYTYKLKEDYKNGNLEIIPDVVSYRSCSSSSSALQLTNLLTRCHI